MIILENYGYHRYNFYMYRNSQYAINTTYNCFLHKLCIYVILVVVFAINCSASYSQIFYYQDDNDNPYQFYPNTENYNNGYNTPNQYYYYNAPDPDQLMNQVNQLFKRMFGEDFDIQENNKLPYSIRKQFSNQFGQLDKGNSDNRENNIDPAPNYIQRPDIYY